MRLTTSPPQATQLQGDRLAPAPCTSVLFDGSCPLCSREIALYRGLPASGPLQWVDVSAPDYCPPPGITRAALMQRFHVIRPDGRMLVGALAFVHVWSQLPGWRHLARVASLPGVAEVMEAVYRGFLLVRPSVQSIYRRWHGQAQR